MISSKIVTIELLRDLLSTRSPLCLLYDIHFFTFLSRTTTNLLEAFIALKVNRKHLLDKVCTVIWSAYP